jgi:hypothetical protein
MSRKEQPSAAQISAQQMSGSARRLYRPQPEPGQENKAPNSVKAQLQRDENKLLKEYFMQASSLVDGAVYHLFAYYLSYFV